MRIIIPLFIVLFILPTHSRAGTCGGGSCGISMDVTVRVLNLSGYGMRNEDLKDMGIVHSTAWWVKQCCMQQSHRLGIRSVECDAPEVKEPMEQGICQAIFYEPASGDE